MATTSFRLMGFNILGVRFSSKVSWLLRRPRIVKRASRVFNDVDTDFASIYTFLECRQYEADYLKAELGWTDSLRAHWVAPLASVAAGSSANIGWSPLTPHMTR